MEEYQMHARTIVIAALVDRIVGRTRLTAEGGESSDMIVRRWNENKSAVHAGDLKTWLIRRRASARTMKDGQYQ